MKYQGIPVFRVRTEEMKTVKGWRRSTAEKKKTRQIANK